MTATANPISANPAPPPEVSEVIVGKVGAAHMLHWSLDTLERKIRAGQFPPGFRLGRQLYWHKPALVAFLAAQRPTPASGT